MKTTTIPAQITTVEDTIAGNLTLTQILLLIAPVFGSTIIYAVLPPNMSIVIYKLVLMTILSLSFISLAIRFRGKLIINWLNIIFKYSLRPHIYLFNKNTNFSREIVINQSAKLVTNKAKNKKLATKKRPIKNSILDFQILARDEELNVRFTKKGFLVIKNI